MRVQVSARSGTMTPNSSEPNRVRVVGLAWNWFLISWSIDRPLAQPAGVCEPPWMLPGNSSVPVKRQPMPRMWLSPSPRTLSQTPCRISVRSRNGASGLRLSLSVNDVPPSSGQNAFGTTPLGLNITTSRCLRRCWLANPRPGRFSRNGRAAAPIPRSRMNSRRVLCKVTSFLRLLLAFLVGWRQCGSRRDLYHQLADIILVIGERLSHIRQLSRAEGAHRLLDQVVEYLFDKRLVR